MQAKKLISHFVIIALILSTSTVFAAVEFSSGSHTIDYAINDDISVHGWIPGPPLEQTEVSIQSGANISGEGYFHAGSASEMTGGVIQGNLRVQSGATFHVYDGLIGSSTANLVSRSGGDWFMHGGTATGADMTLASGGLFNLTGGNVNILGGILIENSAILDVSSGGFNVSDAMVMGFAAQAIFTGSNFLHNGNPVGPGKLDVAGTVSTLSGSLVDGSAFAITIDATDPEFLLDNEASVTLVATPVPAPGAILLSSIGLGLIHGLKRRKSL